MIDQYFHKEEGYNPFLISEGWQVAQLNYLPHYGFDEIEKVEVHKDTDEAFILFNGSAVLIAASFENEETKFECISMKKGVTYNLPKGVWHNIAMAKDAQMIIVEKDNTHLNDVIHHELSEKEIKTLKKLIQGALNH